MKKKIFFALLAAVMVLPGCGASSKTNIMLEDTLAHEEIFGNAELKLIDLKPRYAQGFIDLDQPEPLIGIQSQDAGDYFHLRFVAAIDGDYASATAKWFRILYDASGNAVTTKRGDINITAAYTSLKNGESVLTISDFNSAHNDAGYDYFIVYTMRNIPKATHSNYYLSAFAVVNDSSSNALTTKLDRSYSVITSYANGYYLTGTFNGKQSYIASDADLDGNLARFTADFKSADVFKIVRRDYDAFYIWGSSGTFDGDGSDVGTYFADSSGSISPISDGNYRLYFNTDCDFFTDRRGDCTPRLSGLFVRGPAASGSDETSGAEYDWRTIEGYELTRNRENNGQILNVHLNRGRFKIANNAWTGKIYGYSDLEGGTATIYGSDDNTFWCNTAGYYDIYVNADDQVYINDHVS